MATGAGVGTHGGGPGSGAGGGRTGGARLEVAQRAPAEHGLGEQDVQSAVEVAELLGGVPAETAVREMPADIRQQGSAAAQGNVEETVVEAAFAGRREFPVGAYAGRPELFPRLFQDGRRGHGIHARQTSRYGYGIRLHLRVPQQALGG